MGFGFNVMESEHMTASLHTYIVQSHFQEGNDTLLGSYTETALSFLILKLLQWAVVGRHKPHHRKVTHTHTLDIGSALVWSTDCPDMNQPAIEAFKDKIRAWILIQGHTVRTKPWLMTSHHFSAPGTLFPKIGQQDRSTNCVFSFFFFFN